MNNRNIVLKETAVKTLDLSEKILMNLEQSLIAEACTQIDQRDIMINVISNLIANNDSFDREFDLDEFNRIIIKIQKIDEIIIQKLIEARENTKNDIGSLHNKKENFKGYNLNDTK